MFGDSADQASANDGNDVICSQKKMMSMLKIIIDKTSMKNRLDEENKRTK